MSKFLKDYFNFKKKQIIILGGSKGIGLEIAKKLILLKAKLVIISRTKPNLNAKFMKCDFENLEEVKNVAKQLKKKYKKNWAIINCLSITIPSKKKCNHLNILKKQ